MSVWYRDIKVLQEPFDLGLDANSRPRVAFNIAVTKGPSDTFEEEIIGILVAANVGTLGTDLFISSRADIPSKGGTFLSVIATGGMTPERTHNSVSTPAYQRPGAQIVVRGDTWEDARTMARAAYNALVGVRNIAI